MAKTIEEAFRTLRTNLEVTGLQESRVSTGQQRIRSLLEGTAGGVMTNDGVIQSPVLFR